eukprot:scaffold2320_cov168-Ochromonas_danica.AAC.8
MHSRDKDEVTSQLPLCDRLSLKGKLFELQKKLQLIDLEQKMNEQFPYKPQILSSYELPNRQHDFLENINKAEIIRKQRKELLAQSAVQQSEESCTFTPVLFTRREKSGARGGKASTRDKQSVYERLVEKGKEYEESHRRRKEFYSSIDLNDGRKLFTPRLAGGSHQSPQTSSAPAAGPAVAAVEASVEDFLYQDAKDREIRLQQRARDEAAQLASSASSKKMNPLSASLLQQRAEKQALRLFSVMDKDGNGIIGYEDVQSELQMERPAALLWRLLDSSNEGQCSQEVSCHVLKLCIGHQSWDTLQRTLRSTEPVKKSEFEELQRVLLELLRKHDKESRKDGPGGGGAGDEAASFRPHIDRRSLKLAEKRVERERKEIVSALAEQGEGAREDAEGSLCSTHDRLFARSLLLKKQQQVRAEEMRKEELQRCTFRPELKTVSRRLHQSSAAVSHQEKDAGSPSKRAGSGRVEGPVGKAEGGGDVEFGKEESNDEGDKDLDSSGLTMDDLATFSCGGGGGSVYDRLYQSARSKQLGQLESSAAAPPPAYLSDLQACTFAPKIHPYIKTKSSPSIAGFEDSVERLKKVREERQQEKEAEERAHEVAEESYQRSRELAKRGPEPFKLNADGRLRQRQNKQQSKDVETPQLLIDVKLGGARNARIRVVQGDDPKDLAKRFGRIYGLDNSAVQLLATVVRKSMSRSGLLLHTPTSNKAEIGEEGAESSFEECSSYTVTGSEGEEDNEDYDDEDEEEVEDYDVGDENGLPREVEEIKPAKRRARGGLRSSVLSQLL